MSLASNWLLVDVLSVNQAAALWCNADPKIVSPMDLTTPSEVMAIRQMLAGAIISGDLSADSSKNIMARHGDYSDSLIKRKALEEFAKSKKQYPAFLFDTIAPFVDPRDAPEPRPMESAATSATTKGKPNKGGRPTQYDWDSFTMEIIRIADSPDGLPDTQAELVREMLSWFYEQYECEPAESTVKQRISKIYNHLNKDKTSTVGFLPHFG